MVKLAGHVRRVWDGADASLRESFISDGLLPGGHHGGGDHNGGGDGAPSNTGGGSAVSTAKDVVSETESRKSTPVKSISGSVAIPSNHPATGLTVAGNDDNLDPPDSSNEDGDSSSTSSNNDSNSSNAAKDNRESVSEDEDEDFFPPGRNHPGAPSLKGNKGHKSQDHGSKSSKAMSKENSKVGKPVVHRVHNKYTPELRASIAKFAASHSPKVASQHYSIVLGKPVSVPTVCYFLKGLQRVSKESGIPWNQIQFVDNKKRGPKGSLPITARERIREIKKLDIIANSKNKSKWQ